MAATHRKTPIFLRVSSDNHSVLCVNTSMLSSFHIVEGSEVTLSRDCDLGKKGEKAKTNTIRLFFPTGTGLTYHVGIDITIDEFQYIASTLSEFLYMNETEFNAKKVAIDKDKMEGWNKLSQENEEKLIVQGK